MSNDAVTPVASRKPRVKIVFVILALLILLLVYGVGLVAFPFSVHRNFQTRNCDGALTLHRIYASLYPEFMRDQTLSDPIQECEAYVLAAGREEDESWQESYDAYQDYLYTYPNGLYVQEAHEHGAIALMGVIKEQAEHRKYDEAVTNLNLIISSYSDTSALAEAWTLLPSTYTSWAADLREAEDFALAEQVLNDFKALCLTAQRNDCVTEAQRELAQTYLDWGLDFQSQKQYEDALAKFDLAVSVDPQSQFDSAAQVKLGQSHVYVEWGNDLLEQEQFPLAIEKFDLAVAKSKGTQDDSTQDAWVNGQIQWAYHLSAEEDFQSALEHLRFARETAASDAMSASVDTALQDTYLAFSKSSGPQARRAIKEVLKTVCEKHKVPDLPIFGLDKDEIRFGIQGVDDQLPEKLAARTPGEMHYVACIKADNRTVETREHKNIVLRVSNGYYYTMVQQFRVQIIWNVNLLKVDTGKSIAEQTFPGAQPPPFPETGGNYFYGPTPMDKFTEWLQSVVP